MSNYPKRIYVLPTPRPRVIPTLTRVAPVTPPRPMKRVVPTEELVAELLGDDMGPSGPRKRERLNHLTQEEKMDRRKMKNRMAAQNARDKKKERSGKIDEVMRDLVEENRLLRAENERLRRQNEELLHQQQQQPQYINTPCYTPEHSTTDENIYSNVVYEEEVVDEQDRSEVIAVGSAGAAAGAVVNEDQDQLAFESAVFINAPLPWDKANRSKSFNDNNINSNRSNDSVDNANNTAISQKRTDTQKRFTLESVINIITLLSSNQPTMGKKSNNSSESSNILRAHPETSIGSLLATLKTTTPSASRQLQSQEDPFTMHLQKRVKHSRRRALP